MLVKDRKYMKKIKKKKPVVFVPICADMFHHGHINIIEKASKFGDITIGLMTDKGIRSYKKKLPLISYNNRKKIFKHIPLIKKIIPMPGIQYTKYAKKYKFDFFIHGDDWKTGPQSKQRKLLIPLMKKWNGKVIDIPYTKGISSSKIKNVI